MVDRPFVHADHPAGDYAQTFIEPLVAQPIVTLAALAVRSFSISQQAASDRMGRMKEPGAEELRSRRLMLTRPTRGDVGAILVIHQDELASEAASLVVSWAAIHQGAYRVIARVRPANVGSHRVALNAGLIRAPNLDGPGLDGSDHIYTSKPDR